MIPAVQGFEITLEAETASEGYALGVMVNNARAIGMEVSVHHEEKRVIACIAPKLRPGPKKKPPQPPDADEYARQKPIDAADAVERILAGEKPQ